jgi:hypothetical protein
MLLAKMRWMGQHEMIVPLGVSVQTRSSGRCTVLLDDQPPSLPKPIDHRQARTGFVAFNRSPLYCKCHSSQGEHD